MDADAWVDLLARELGLPAPMAAERDAILSLAGVAAHSSERRAAPIACWLAARAGLDAEEALALARGVSAASGDDVT